MSAASAAAGSTASVGTLSPMPNIEFQMYEALCKDKKLEVGQAGNVLTALTYFSSHPSEERAYRIKFGLLPSLLHETPLAPIEPGKGQILAPAGMFEEIDEDQVPPSQAPVKRGPSAAADAAAPLPSPVLGQAGLEKPGAQFNPPLNPLLQPAAAADAAPLQQAEVASAAPAAAPAPVPLAVASAAPAPAPAEAAASDVDENDNDAGEGEDADPAAAASAPGAPAPAGVAEAAASDVDESDGDAGEGEDAGPAAAASAPGAPAPAGVAEAAASDVDENDGDAGEGEDIDPAALSASAMAGMAPGDAPHLSESVPVASGWDVEFDPALPAGEIVLPGASPEADNPLLPRAVTETPGERNQPGGAELPAPPASTLLKPGSALEFFLSTHKPSDDLAALLGLGKPASDTVATLNDRRPAPLSPVDGASDPAPAVDGGASPREIIIRSDESGENGDEDRNGQRGDSFTASPTRMATPPLPAAASALPVMDALPPLQQRAATPTPPGAPRIPQASGSFFTPSPQQPSGVAGSGAHEETPVEAFEPQPPTPAAVSYTPPTPPFIPPRPSSAPPATTLYVSDAIPEQPLSPAPFVPSPRPVQPAADSASPVADPAPAHAVGSGGPITPATPAPAPAPTPPAKNAIELFFESIALFFIDLWKRFLACFGYNKEA